MLISSHKYTLLTRHGIYIELAWDLRKQVLVDFISAQQHSWEYDAIR